MSSPDNTENEILKTLRNNQDFIKESVEKSNKLTPDQIEAYMWMIQTPEIQRFYGHKIPAEFYDFYQHNYKHETMAPIIEFINIFTINGGKNQVDFLPHFHRVYVISGCIFCG